MPMYSMYAKNTYKNEDFVTGGKKLAIRVAF